MDSIWSWRTKVMFVREFMLGLKLLWRGENVGHCEVVCTDGKPKFFNHATGLAGFAAPCYGNPRVGNSTIQGMDAMRALALTLLMIGFTTLLPHSDAFAQHRAPVHVRTFTGPGVDRVIGEALAAAFQSALILQTGRRVFTDADVTTLFEPVSREGKRSDVNDEKYADWIWAALAQYGESDTVFGRLTLLDGKRARLHLVWFQGGKMLHEATEELAGGRGGWLRSMEAFARKFLQGIDPQP